MSETTQGEGAAAAAAPLDYDIRKILAALPHRYPLLLVDRVKSMEVGEKIHAVKAVTFNEQFFQGHFPGRPIMPGVLLVEGSAQVATVLMKKRERWGMDRFIGLGGLDDVRFRGTVVPPTTVYFVSKVGNRSTRIAKYPAQCFCDGKLVMEMEMLGILL